MEGQRQKTKKMLLLWLAFFLSLGTVSTVSCLPDCLPTAPGPSTALTTLRSSQLCCKLNEFRTICSSAGASGPGSVNINFTYSDDDQSLALFSGDVINMSVDVNQTGGTMGTHVAFKPSLTTSVSIFFHLKSTEENDIVKMESTVEKRAAVGALAAGPSAPLRCTTLQVVGHVGSTVRFDVATECGVGCVMHGGKKRCTALGLCSKPIFSSPDQPRSKVTEFFFGIASEDGTRVIELLHLSLKDGASTHFDAINNFLCDGSTPKNSVLRYYGNAQVVGNPKTRQYQVLVTDFAWTDVDGLSGDVQNLWTPG
jgi:hypothetical protein